MAQVRKWSNVAIAMESALAAAVTITAISKAAPGIFSCATPPANGTFIKLAIQGMWQLDGRVFRVCNVVAGTSFQVENPSGGTGLDTSGFDTFVSGTAQVITFGTSITTAVGVSASGGDFDFIDTTTIHGNQKTQIPGLPNPATYTFDNIWDVSDAGLNAMKAASDNQAQKAFKFTFGNGGQIMVFNGYPAASLLPGGSAQDKVTTQTVVTMFGSPTYYSS